VFFSLGGKGCSRGGVFRSAGRAVCEPELARSGIRLDVERLVLKIVGSWRAGKGASWARSRSLLKARKARAAGDSLVTVVMAKPFDSARGTSGSLGMVCLNTRLPR